MPSPPPRAKSTSPAAPPRAALFWLPCAGIALGDRALGLPWLHGADLACGLFLLLWLAGAWPRWRRGERPLLLPAWAAALGLFVGAGLLSGVAGFAAGEPRFDAFEFAKSAARLVFGAALALALHDVLRRTGATPAAAVLRDAFALAGAVALLLFGLVSAGVELPERLVCGDERTTCSSLYYERRWFGDGSPAGLRHDAFLRAQGLAAEPTRYGYLQAMALGLLLLRRPARPAPGVRHALIALAALASFALAPYALLAATAALFAWRVLRHGTPALRRRAAAGAVAVALLVALPPLGPSLHRAVFVRVQKIAAGGLDSSAFLRVAGGWVMARHLMAERPLTGAGLGHFDVGVAALRGRLPAAHLLEGRIQGWNALTYVLGATGLLGLLAFAWLCWRALRAQPGAAPVFLLGLLADGTVLGAAFWVFLTLYAHPPDAPEPAA